MVTAAAERFDVAIVSTAHPAGDGRLWQWARGFAAVGASVAVTAVGTAPMPDGVALHSLEPASRWNRPMRAIRLASQTQARVVVAIDPELWGPVLATQRARGALAIADVHEDFAALATDHDRWGPALTRRAVSLGSSGLAQAVARCDAVVVADEHLPPARARWRIVGRNVPDAADYDLAQARSQHLHAVYAGDLTPQRGLGAMLDGVVAARAWSLDLFGPDRPWARDAIAAAERASNGRVRYRGHVARQELNAALPSYHVGLCLLDRIPSYDAALPAKVLEYQAAGLATIASDLPRAVEALSAKSVSGEAESDEVGSGDAPSGAAGSSAESGVVLAAANGSVSAGQLTDALERLATDPDRLARLQDNARRTAEAHRPVNSLAQAVSMLTILLESP